ARRCRSCVAKETGARRSVSAQATRERIKQDFGLRVGISGRRLQQIEKLERETAEGNVPRTRRDEIGALCDKWGGVGIFLGVVSPFFIAPYLGIHGGWEFVLAAGLVAAGVGLRYASRYLDRPRRAVVDGIARKLVRAAVLTADQQQLDAMRFYTTPEWRAARQ